MGAQSNTKSIAIAGVVFLVALYRLGGPFLEGTKQMAAEEEKLVREIRELKDTAAMYTDSWEQKMKEREEKSKTRLPDAIDSSGVLDYFLAKFEQGNVGHVSFTSVSQQQVASTNFKAGTAAARAVRYKIESQMNQDRVVPYIEHIERYPSLFRVDSFNILVSPEVAGLKMDLTLEFYVAPREWGGALEPIVASKEEKVPGAPSKPKAWQQIFLSSFGGKADRKPAFSGRKAGKVPVFSSILGTSVISNEGLYEEGDKVNGWRILQIDSKERTVKLSNGVSVKTVVVK